ncbi:MAG: hypothetical protein ABIH23_29345, partial [bacterium]
EDPFHRSQHRGLGVAGSPDGFHWKPIKEWATEAICDGGTHWMFDPASQKYVLYGRTKFVSPDVKEAWSENEWVKQYFWGRSVARVESSDFINWAIVNPGKAPVVMTSDLIDSPGTEIYSMQVFPYESVYIGLVQVFYSRPETCHLDIQLAVSRDSVTFTRVGDRTPFIPVGPVGTWDRFNTSVANNPPIPVGDDLRFYYSGRTYRHSPYKGPDKGESGGGIGFGAIQRDRFVSLAASFDGGTILTKPVRLLGENLHINAKSDFGEILVEVLDMDGKVIAKSKPIRRDDLDILIEWDEGDLKNVIDPVRLRITLKNSRLYAIWCR